MCLSCARRRCGLPSCQLLPLTKPDFIKEVNDASRDGTWVVVLLVNSSDESRLVEERLAPIVRGNPATKFMKIEATQCIENYPHRCAPPPILCHNPMPHSVIVTPLVCVLCCSNVPTILFYRHGDLVTQLVSIAMLGGRSTTTESTCSQLCPCLHTCTAGNAECVHVPLSCSFGVDPRRRGCSYHRTRGGPARPALTRQQAGDPLLAAVL